MKKIGREKKDKKWVENIILKVSGRNKKKVSEEIRWRKLVEKII